MIEDWPMDLERFKQLETYAEEMRIASTESEEKFFIRLQEYAKIKRVEFVFQQVFNRWIFDFYLPDVGVFIEIDGSYHLNPEQIEKDRIKQNAAESLGFKVIHITNEGVMSFDFSKLPRNREYGLKLMKNFQEYNYKRKNKKLSKKKLKKRELLKKLINSQKQDLIKDKKTFHRKPI